MHAHAHPHTPLHAESWLIALAGQKVLEEWRAPEAGRERESCCSWRRQGKQAAPSRLQWSHTNSAETVPVLTTSSSSPAPFQILSFYTMFELLASFSLWPLHPRLCTAQWGCYFPRQVPYPVAKLFFLAYLLLFFSMLKAVFSSLSRLYFFNDQ